jgi:hypothetical protein
VNLTEKSLEDLLVEMRNTDGNQEAKIALKPTKFFFFDPDIHWERNIRESIAEKQKEIVMGTKKEEKQESSKERMKEVKAGDKFEQNRIKSKKVAKKSVKKY